MSTSMMNGRQRKSLSEQIDRLDSLLDGLAEGLNEAVAEAVRQAVRAVLTEVLANPDLLARLAAAQGISVAESRPKGQWLSRTWNAICAGIGWVRQQITFGGATLGRVCRASWDKTRRGAGRAKAKAFQILIASSLVLLRARSLLVPTLAAAALAGLTGVAADQLGPWMAAGVAGIGGMGMALAVPATGDEPRWFRPCQPVGE